MRSVYLVTQSNCRKVIDKYVEYDAVILLLDILLLRIQAYRHLIFNYGVNPSVSQLDEYMIAVCIYS